MESLFNYGSEEEEEEVVLVEGKEAVLATVSAAPEIVREVVQATESSSIVDAAPALRSILSDTVLLQPDAQVQEVKIVVEDPAQAGKDPTGPDDAAAAAAEKRDACWLPPEIAHDPPEPCPKEIQDIVSDYIKKQAEKNTTITASLKALPGYKNPDFLQHCVKYDDIQEYGSCYPSDIFAPYNLPEEDYYDRLAAEWNLHLEKKQEERQKRQKIEFQRATELQRAPAPSRTAAVSKAQAERLASKIGGSSRSKWDSKSARR